MYYYFLLIASLINLFVYAIPHNYALEVRHSH